MGDVAAIAGVSQRTVSNVVRGFRHVAPATRQRVLAAIDEIGYRPNVTAQRLRQGRTGLVALAVPDLTWPYFSGLAQVVQRRAREAGLTLVVTETRGTAEYERQVLEGFHTGAIDGLILSPIEIDAETLTQMELGIPVVLLGERIQGTGLLHLSVDNVRAAREMMRHLIDRGARKIWVLGSSRTMQTQSAGLMRLRGFEEELEESAPDGAQKQLDASPWTMDEGYQAIVAALKEDSRPDAIVCMNDLLALGALRACWEAGLRVPQDLLISGWDDIPFARFATPGITSIAADVDSIGTRAVAGISLLLEDPDAVMSEVTVDHRLVIRESTLAQRLS